MSLTKASYSLVNGAPFNVLDFGADPTGTANSAAAIQAAIDAAFAAGGGDVWLPAGVYNTGTTSLLMKSMVVLRGDGGQRHGYDGSTIANAATTIKYTGNNYAIRCGDNTYAAEGWQIYNIQLFGDGVGANGIVVQSDAGSSSSGWVMSNVLVNNFTNYGIQFVELCFIGDMYHVNVRNCLTGFRLSAECNRYNFFGCDANNCTTGFEIGVVGGTIQTGISIFGGRAENVGVGVLIDSPTAEVLISGMYIENASVAGIKHQGGGGSLCVYGCPINTNGTANGIEITVDCAVDIVGNHFTGDGTHSINFASGAAVNGKVTGNRFGTTLSGAVITTPSEPDTIIEIESAVNASTREFFRNYVGHLGEADRRWCLVKTSVGATTPSFCFDHDSNRILMGKNTPDNSVTGVDFVPTAGDARFVRAGTATTDVIQFYREGGTLVGNIQVTSAATNYLSASDYRIKENVVPLQGGLEKTLALNPVSFTWKTDGSACDGFIAHEVQLVAPFAVSGVKDAEQDVGDIVDEKENVVSSGMPQPEYDLPPTQTWVKTGTKPVVQSVDPSKLIPYLVAAIKELKAEIDALKST